MSKRWVESKRWIDAQRLELRKSTGEVRATFCFRGDVAKEDRAQIEQTLETGVTQLEKSMRMRGRPVIKDVGRWPQLTRRLCHPRYERLLRKRYATKPYVISPMMKELTRDRLDAKDGKAGSLESIAATVFNKGFMLAKEIAEKGQ